MDIGLPTSKKYFAEFIKQALRPALKKQSVTISYVYGTGKNSLLKHLETHRQNVEDLLTPQLDSLVTLRFSPNCAKSWLQSLKLRGITLQGNNLSAEETLNQLTRDLKRRVLLCSTIDESGEAIEEMQRLREVNSLQIELQFGLDYELPSDKFRETFGDMANLALQNIWYMPFYDQKSSEAVIKNQVDAGFVEINSKQSDEIMQLGGGYALLIRYLLRNLDKDEKRLLQDPELISIMQRIWDGLSDDSQFWLFSTAKGSSNPTESPSEYLKTGLIRGEKNSWKFFSPLFNQYILNLAELKLPEIKQDNDRLIVAGQDAEKLLSNKQFDFFTLLWEKKDKITSRNEIAQILWGENWVDKYSDWAIDQFVKRTRNRINDRGDKKVIKTVRGKGYTLGME